MRIAVIITLIFFVSCATDKPVVEKKPGNTGVVKVETPVTGWMDEDTYTVQVTAETVEMAKEMARHKILKDIVNVRVRNGSRYTDITKISGEFEKPLKEGRIIQEKNAGGNIEIFFQITDKGLKKKFERQ